MSTRTENLTCKTCKTCKTWNNSVVAIQHCESSRLGNEFRADRQATDYHSTDIIATYCNILQQIATDCNRLLCLVNLAQSCTMWFNNLNKTHSNGAPPTEPRLRLHGFSSLSYSRKVKALWATTTECVIKLFYSPKRLRFVAVSFAATANKRDIDACTRTGDLFGVDPFVCWSQMTQERIQMLLPESRSVDSSDFLIFSLWTGQVCDGIVWRSSERQET